MEEFFKILFEFDHLKVDSIIQDAVRAGGKGFVCVVEGNVVAVARDDSGYRNMVNSALVNICDSSYIALFYSWLRRKRIQPYIGGDLFFKFLGMRKYRHVFLGATSQVLDSLRKKLQEIDPRIAEDCFMPLPFRAAEEFDYPAIAREINILNPDVIWVSLGAPKQEKFMFYLLPHLDRGVMVGVGAVFDFHSGLGEINRAPEIVLKMKLEWLYRLCREPEKQWKKCRAFLRTLPGLLLMEIRS